MTGLAVRHLTKLFRTTEALIDVTLEIRSGEFFSLLGPSGCGKTTLLRLIAGFETPTGGEVILDGRDITRLPAQARGIGMVFQNYALFPHMTVFQNVAFGLQTKKVPRPEIRDRVESILESVHLGEKRDTPVPLLSGGEQQRVAVARALVTEPAVLLMDEPLSNLDVSLRARTREEIRALQQKTHITTLYVTHDQSEAMSLSDRIAVLRSGKLEQVGAPRELHTSPGSRFIAEFVGGANILEGRILPDPRRLVVGDLALPLPDSVRFQRDGAFTIAIAPEAITVEPGEAAQAGQAVVEGKEYLGFLTNFRLKASGISLRATCVSSDATHRLVPGAAVRICIDWSRCVILPA